MNRNLSEDIPLSTFGFLSALLWSAAVGLLTTACASAPIRTGAVGPMPEPKSQAADSGIGNLIVYSATTDINGGDTTVFHPHNDYWLTDSSGHTRWIRNHLGGSDETAATICLEAGEYEVLADSEDYGRVHVPITIVRSETTVVSLDGWLRFPKNAESKTAMVCLPNGVPIGWKIKSNP